MNDWFKFGFWRGVLGALVAFLFGIASVKVVPCGVMAAQGLSFEPQMLLPLLLLMIPLSMVVEGAVYWIGYEIARMMGVKASGVEGCVLVGILGALVATPIAVVIALMAIPNASPELMLRATFLGVMSEVIFAPLTYAFYSAMGWRVPEVS